MPLLNMIWVYNGLLSNVEDMIEISKQSTEKVKTNMLKLGSGTPESRALKAKGDTINAVLLAECDYLDQIRNGLECEKLFSDFSLIIFSIFLFFAQKLADIHVYIQIQCIYYGKYLTFLFGVFSVFPSQPVTVVLNR